MIHYLIQNVNMQQNQRKIIASIGAAFIIPLLGSYLLLQFGFIGKPTHNGQLLAHHEPWPTLQQKSWQLLYIPKNEKCDKSCWHDLDQLAKIKVLLGKNQNKVKVLFSSHSKNLPNKNDYLKHVKLTERNKIFHAYGLRENRPHWLIIDPMGRAVLHYTEAQVPKALLQDLQKLLKASRKL